MTRQKLRKNIKAEPSPPSLNHLWSQHSTSFPGSLHRDKALGTRLVSITQSWIAVIGLEPAVKYSFVLSGTQTRLKGQCNAILTLSLRLHVKPLITAIRAIHDVLRRVISCNAMPQRANVSISLIRTHCPLVRTDQGYHEEKHSYDSFMGSPKPLSFMQ